MRLSAIALRLMQVAIGSCYEHEHIRCYEAAAKCYRRAVTSGDHEHIVLHQLACLYQRMDQAEAAFSCFKQNLERLDSQGAGGQVCSVCSGPNLAECATLAAKAMQVPLLTL